MNNITWLNLGLQSLLLTLPGWLLVRGWVRDARQRAWASVMVLCAALVVPPVMMLQPERDTPAPSAPLIAPPVTWLPDWTMKLQVEPILPVAEEPQSQLVPKPFQRADLAHALIWIWLGGSIVLGMMHGVSTVRGLYWRSRLRPGPRAHLWTFQGAGSPCVAGLFGPVIAVPERLCTTWTEDQWQWLTAHEGEHVRGHDPAIAWLLGWLRAVLWWNPLVHDLISQWALAREEVCDAAAIKRTRDHDRYAAFLVDIAAQGHSRPAIAMAASRPARRLRTRLTALLEQRPVRDGVGPGFIAGAILMLGIAATFVSCSGIKPVTEPSALRIKTVFVESKDMKNQVSKLQAEGYVVETKGSQEQGNSVTLRNAKGEIVEVRPPPEKEALMTRAFRVAPDFQTRLSGDTVQAALKRKGIAFPAGASAVFNPTTSQLIVRHTTAGLIQIEAIVTDMQGIQPQVYLSMRLIEAPQLLENDGTVLDHDSFDKLLRSIMQGKDMDMLSSPSVTTKLGQKAQVEVGQERPGHSGEFVGLRIDLEPTLNDNSAITIDSAITIAQEIIEGEISRGLLTKKKTREIDWTKVKRWQKSSKVALKHDQTGVIHVGETKKGRFVTALLTARALLPSGQDARSFDRQIRPESSVSPVGSTTPRKEAPGTPIKPGAGKQILVSAKVVELKTALDTNDDMAWMGLDTSSDKGADAGSETSKSNTVPEKVATTVAVAPDMPPQLMVVSGVLTDPQYKTVIRALSQQKRASLVSLPYAMVSSGQAAMLRSNELACNVTPTLGPEGYTIDLVVSDQRPKNVAKGASTSVTLWSGQTLALSQSVTEDPSKNERLTRMLFISIWLIDPTGIPTAKDK